MTTTTPHPYGSLYDADTADYIGPATKAQLAASDDAKGYSGIFTMDADGDPCRTGSWDEQQPGTQKVYVIPPEATLGGILDPDSDIEWLGVNWGDYAECRSAVAGEAAREAAWAAVAPTKLSLQKSARDLLDRLCAVGQGSR